jgi:hypothetical protein
MKSMTKQQRMTWAILRGEVTLSVDKMSAKEVAHDVGRMLSQITNIDQLNQQADKCLGIVMTRKWPPVDVVRVMRTWLTTYQLSLVPGKMSNFDRFHNKYNHYILNNHKKFSIEF